jgi:hypothetical protein
VRIRTNQSERLQAQPTKMLLSAHLISIEIEYCPGVNGKPSDYVIFGVPSLVNPPNSGGSTLPLYTLIIAHEVHSSAL